MKRWSGLLQALLDKSYVAPTLRIKSVFGIRHRVSETFGYIQSLPFS